MFANIYKNKKVLVTGHTGFKGSWLALWLNMLGAKVCGYSLEAPTKPAHYSLLNLDIDSVIADIRDQRQLITSFEDFQPEIVFHLAAQPLVRRSYRDPIETFETNIMGTVNVLEACRKCNSVQAVINVTSDKCYLNKECRRGYCEDDPMGGHDPYSASKGCSELISASYRDSFLKKDGILLATCRAGNVIGGGDWAEDRLIPDIIRGAISGNSTLIRNPYSTRPWQHVLEALSGYLLVGQKLLEGSKEFAEAWNFGPECNDSLGVWEVVERMMKSWPVLKAEKITPNCNQLHEAKLLHLDCTKAQQRLQWHETWNNQLAIKKTVEWYRDFYNNQQVKSYEDLTSFIDCAKEKGLTWTK